MLILKIPILRALDDKAHQYSMSPFPTNLDQILFDPFHLTYFWVSYYKKHIQDARKVWMEFFVTLAYG